LKPQEWLRVLCLLFCRNLLIENALLIEAIGYRMSPNTEIGVQNVLEKLLQSPAEAGAAAERITEFLLQLQAFKIGNVLSIHYEGDGTFTLRKEADRPPGNKVPLP